MIAIYSNAFAQFSTSQNEVQIEGAAAAKSTPQLPDELATAETTPAEPDNHENEAPHSEEKGELDAGLGTKNTDGRAARPHCDAWGVAKWDRNASAGPDCECIGSAGLSA